MQIIHRFDFYFDYAYIIRLSDITKPTIWPLPLQSICKYSNAHNFHIFSTDLRPFHIYTETEPKPNRNRTEKLKCLKPYGRFHICAETETEPKPNAEPKTCTNWILFFSVSVAEFQQTRQVNLIKTTHTQPPALYIT